MKKPAPTLPQSLLKKVSLPEWRLPFGREAMPTPEVVVEPELRLRALKPQDDEALYLLIETNRWHLEPWLSWIEDIHNLPDTRAFLKSVNYRDVYGSGWVFGIELRGKLVGLMDINEGDVEAGHIALGYWLDADAEGQGIITRTVRRCLDYVFEQQAVQRVYIKCATDNVRSEAVPKRLGFTWGGIDYGAGQVKGKSVDLVIYHLDSAQWRALRD